MLPPPQRSAGRVLRLAASVVCGAALLLVVLSFATATADDDAAWQSDLPAATEVVLSADDAAPATASGGLREWLFGDSVSISAARTGNTSWDKARAYRMPRNRVPVRHGGIIVSK